MSESTELTTRLVRLASSGDRSAQEELYDRVYEELRRRARRMMARQSPGHLLQTTALVNEAWIRMLGGNPVDARDRTHFVAVAASAMRQVLVDYARRRLSEKRGAGAAQVRLDAVSPAVDGPGWRILAIEEGLQRIGERDALALRVAELRLFGGLEHREIASFLGAALRTVERAWKTAREIIQETCGEP